MLITEADCVRALPPKGFLRRYVAYASKLTDAPLGYHIATGLTILAQIVPEAIQMRISFARTMPHIFTLIIGGSSKSRKGAAIGLAREIIEGAELPILSDPASKESMIVALAENPKQIWLLPEFAAFLTAAQQGPFMAIKSSLNNVADGVAINNIRVAERRNRRMDLAECKAPRMSILGGCDPDYLIRHSEKVDWTSGFFARFFCIFQDRERIKHIGKDQPEIRAALINTLRYFKERSEEVRSGVNQFTGLTERAQARWIKWSESLEERREKVFFSAPFSRAGEIAQKIALILSCDYGNALSNNRWSIDLDVLEPSIAIAELHIASVMRLSEHIAENPEMMDRASVLRHIDYDRAIGAGNLLRLSRMMKLRFERVISTLIEEGTIRALPSLANSERRFIRIREKNQDQDPIPLPDFADELLELDPPPKSSPVQTDAPPRQSDAQKARPRSKLIFAPQDLE